MDRHEEQVRYLLKAHGAKPRTHVGDGHEVWELPSGQKFTMPNSPSDVRAWKNSLSDLKVVLGLSNRGREAVVGERREHKPGKFNRGENFMEIQDQTVLVDMGKCRDCGQQWEMEAKQVAWFKERIKESPTFSMPKRCEACRAKKNGNGHAPVNATVTIKPGITLTMGQPAPPPRPDIPDNRTTRRRVIDAYRADDKSYGALTRIAKVVGTTAQTVRNHLIDEGLVEGTPSGTRKPRTNQASKTPIPEVPTVESLSSEEGALRAKLAEIERKKQLLIEAKRTKIEWSQDRQRVVIKKEGNVLALSENDALDLVHGLTEFLTQPEVLA